MKIGNKCVTLNSERIFKFVLCIDNDQMKSIFEKLGNDFVLKLVQEKLREFEQFGLATMLKVV